MAGKLGSLLITGGNGNIGQKIAKHMLAGTVGRSGEAKTWHVKLCARTRTNTPLPPSY